MLVFLFGYRFYSVYYKRDNSNKYYEKSGILLIIFDTNLIYKGMLKSSQPDQEGIEKKILLFHHWSDIGKSVRQGTFQHHIVYKRYFL